MEGADRPFCQAVRAYGADLVTLTLSTLALPLKWPGIFALLKAKAHEKRLTEYAYDLLWMITRTKYENFEAPRPSNVYRPETKKDTRSAQEILEDLKKKFGG